MKEIPTLYKRKEECCGCTACYAICPKDAISMVEDEEGFDYPEIDEGKCVRCYQCVKVCPIKAEKSVNVDARTAPARTFDRTSTKQNRAQNEPV